MASILKRFSIVLDSANIDNRELSRHLSKCIYDDVTYESDGSEEFEEPVVDGYLLKEMIEGGERIPSKTSFSSLFGKVYEEILSSHLRHVNIPMKRIMRAEVESEESGVRTVDDVMKVLKLK